MIAYIADNDRAGADDDIVANMLARNDIATDAQKAGRADMNISGQRGSRRDVGTTADYAIMVDAGTSVNNGQIAHDSFGINYCAGHDRHALTDAGTGRQHRMRANRTRQLVAQRAGSSCKLETQSICTDSDE